MRVTNPEDNEPVTIEDVVVVADTGKAIKCVPADDPNADGYWIPKSQICDESEVYSAKSGIEPGKLIIPRWLAKEKGLDE